MLFHRQVIAELNETETFKIFTLVSSQNRMFCQSITLKSGGLQPTLAQEQDY